MEDGGSDGKIGGTGWDCGPFRVGEMFFSLDVMGCIHSPGSSQPIMRITRKMGGGGGILCNMSFLSFRALFRTEP